MSFHGRARYGVLGALSLFYFLLMAFTFNSLGQVLPFMVTDLKMSWGEAGFGFTLLGIACGGASLLPAVLIRLAGVARTLLVGSAMLIAGFVALAIGRSVFTYYLGATLLGLGYCFCGTVPSVHVISSIFARRSTALGIYFTSGNLGAVGGPLVFYAFSELLDGWRSYWLFCAAATLAAGALAAIVARDRAPAATAGVVVETPAPPDGWAARRALVSPQYWVIVLAYTGCLLVNTTVHSFAFQHLMENGQSKGAATALISLAALVGAGAAAAAGLVGERLEARRLTMLSLGALAVTSLSLASPHHPAALLLFALSMGVGLGFSSVSTALLLQDYFGRRENLELFSIMTVISTSAAIGPGLGGMVRDRTGSFSGVFLALAVIDAALLVAVFIMRRPAAEDAPAPASPLGRPQPRVG